MVPCFRCSRCGREFSQQTFAFSYYLKRADLSVPIAKGLVGGSGHRQIARTIGCAPSTVTRRVARLGRHALLLNELAAREVPAESRYVHDDFEGFAESQDQPIAVGTTVGTGSWFIHALEPSMHARTGRKTPAQRARLARRDLPRHRGARARAFRRVVDRLLARAPGPVTLVTDDDPTYARVIASHPERRRITHEVHRNPKRGPKGSPRTREARARDRAMRPIDALHMVVRHSKAHHRRETIAFARLHVALVERFHVFVVWRNFVKQRLEQRLTPSSAQILGLTDEIWTWTRVLAKRLFPFRVGLTPATEPIYRRTWATPGVPHRPHELKHAF